MNTLTNIKEDKDLEEYIPYVDIIENDNEYILKADLPGVSKEGLDISVDEEILSLRGEVSKDFREFYPRVYTRKFILNTSSIKKEGIKAQVLNGTLMLTLPKSESLKAKKININVT